MVAALISLMSTASPADAADANLSAVSLVGAISETASTYATFDISNGVPDVPLCVTPYGGGTANGTRLVQWRCNGDWSQDWHYVTTDYGKLIVNNKSGRCITPFGGSANNGTYLTLWTCDSLEISQKWGLGNYGYLKNLHSEKYITPYGGGFGSGTDLTLWSWIGNGTQDWSA